MSTFNFSKNQNFKIKFYFFRWYEERTNLPGLVGEAHFLGGVTTDNVGVVTCTNQHAA